MGRGVSNSDVCGYTSTFFPVLVWSVAVTMTGENLGGVDRTAGPRASPIG